MSRSVLKDGSPSESAIQKAVFKWVRMQPQLQYIVFKIANEGKRTPSYGRRMKEEGVLRGVFDIFVARARHDFNGMWLELKSRNGVLSLDQHKFKKAQEAEGFLCIVSNDIEEAIDTIAWYAYGD